MEPETRNDGDDGKTMADLSSASGQVERQNSRGLDELKAKLES